MTLSTAKEWPISALETLDREIGNRLQRLSAGEATAQDVSEASRLIRDRANYMMPGIFRRLRLRRAAKKAS
ncbi:MAG: hypothetical protein AB1508_01200 [Pseudomonadota bacterium]